MNVKTFENVKLMTQFEQSSTHENIQSGENLMDSLGKISKFYQDTDTTLSILCNRTGYKNVIGVKTADYTISKLGQYYLTYDATLDMYEFMLERSSSSEQQIVVVDTNDLLQWDSVTTDERPILSFLNYNQTTFQSGCTFAILRGSTITDILQTTDDDYVFTDSVFDREDQIVLRIPPNTEPFTCSFRLMIRRSEFEYDRTYEPPAFTNRKLYQTLDSNKVDKVSGKGLSTNDYSDADKSKVDKCLTVDTLPLASDESLGVVKTNGSYGIQIDDGAVYIDSATNSEIDSREQQHKPITPKNLSYAVKSVVSGSTDYDQLATDELLNVWNWLSIHICTQAEYDALIDKSGLHIIVKE